MQKKWLVIPAAAVAIGVGVAMTTVSPVSAQGPGSDDMHQKMISIIAEKFGKSEDEVKALFEEIHTEHREQRSAALQTKLSDAVTAGTITEQQKQLILEKMETLKEERQERTEVHKADREQRKTERESKRAELEAWAEANGIDLEFLKSLHEGGPGAGQHLRGRLAK